MNTYFVNTYSHSLNRFKLLRVLHIVRPADYEIALRFVCFSLLPKKHTATNDTNYPTTRVFLQDLWIKIKSLTLIHKTLISSLTQITTKMASLVEIKINHSAILTNHQSLSIRPSNNSDLSQKPWSAWLNFKTFPID